LLNLDLSIFAPFYVADIRWMFADCASTSKACRIICTQDFKDWLLGGGAVTTSMTPGWFILGDAANGGSSLDEIPKEEW
jgi:hypothetical protein